ncbi:MAG: hypothetical protein V9G23_03245 [Giesbergeria sp.]
MSGLAAIAAPRLAGQQGIEQEQPLALDQHIVQSQVKDGMNILLVVYQQHLPRAVDQRSLDLGGFRDKPGGQQVVILDPLTVHRFRGSNGFGLWSSDCPQSEDNRMARPADGPVGRALNRQGATSGQARAVLQHRSAALPQEMVHSSRCSVKRS